MKGSWGFDWGTEMQSPDQNYSWCMDPDSEENVNGVQRERAVESSASKQHFFEEKANLLASSWEFYWLHLCLVQCVYLFIKVEGFSDSRLQQLPSSCCWTRGADLIKNAWEQHLFCSCKTCAKYPCTHAACLVVSMQCWSTSLSRGRIEVCDADFFFFLN